MLVLLCAEQRRWERHGECVEEVLRKLRRLERPLGRLVVAAIERAAAMFPKLEVALALDRVFARFWGQRFQDKTGGFA